MGRLFGFSMFCFNYSISIHARIYFMQVLLLLSLFTYAHAHDYKEGAESKSNILQQAQDVTKITEHIDIHPSAINQEGSNKIREENSLKQVEYSKIIDRNINYALSTLTRQEKEISRIRKALLSISKVVGSFMQEKERQSVEKDKFVAVFDGGSTGTRLNIYQFNEKGLALKSHLFKNISPGIHLSQNPEEDIKSLLSFGKTYLEKHGHTTGYDFPVVFNGTAGLRLISESARNSLLERIKKTILSETEKKEVEVRVIDGKEEGFYAWAALAFVTQLKEKIGIIDLGGGSAQISFEVDKDAQSIQEGIVHGKNKDVLSRSFLGMGLVAGLNQIHEMDTKNYCKWGSPTFDVSKCKGHIKSTISTMIQSTTHGKEVAPGLSQINTIFVSSFIAEMLHMIKTPSTAQFKDIKEIATSVCKNSINSPNKTSPHASSSSNPSPHTTPAPDCVSVLYTVMFMENLGVGLFTPIKNVSTIPTDISWSLGRALSLIE
ncbi:ectonucleoside triphosphate diphosphohydrolase 5/6 [Nematocida sp. AWRm78]|nr:ectonucleoside triphosphate diphosphohydrolase 5/6 [Nematocida sp. AWRm79]KAI5183219.1 ectonucleoside triphosphate diphosphohydrolase 5/6 [Nematocida sp. AWRm78]